MRTKAYALYGLPPRSPRTVAADHGLQWSMGALIDMLLGWHERARQRRTLLTLDDCMLKDIGVSRTDAELEANKPFWRC
ncbi:MAG: DUF1127 domain-containing protein [Gammaproteobacteria bacterium]|nr:DUF1127 domain-containing protein [Gammaproteobacteria bacterium]